MERSLSGKQDSSVNYLPCKIDYNGSAEISSYFMVKKEADGSLGAQFRGRGLQGEILELSKFKGLNEKAKMNVRGLVVTHNSDNPHFLEIEGQFNKMHIWQHDRKPDLQEVSKYLDHLEITQSIHEM